MDDRELLEEEVKTFRDFPIKRRHDGSYIVTHNGYPCHVPNTGDWTSLWKQVDMYAAEHTDQVTDEPAPHVPTEEELLEKAKAKAVTRIDKETSSAILAGFDYTVEAESLHFSYDAFDQQNFADTANAAILSTTAESEARSIPATINWNAYREDGELVRLNLDAKTFLTLYTDGALAHKAAKMEEGGQRKAKVAAAGSIEEVNAV